jgi:hypothetical protein
MRAVIVVALSAATILITAAPAHADDTPDYSGFLNAVAAAGDAPATDDKVIAAGDIICDALRSGVSPLNEDQTVQQAIPGITVVQTEILVHGAQDHICPDTK